MHDRPRIRGKCLITWLLSLAFMMSLVLVPASAAGFDGATFAAPILQDVERLINNSPTLINNCFTFFALLFVFFVV